MTRALLGVVFMMLMMIKNGRPWAEQYGHTCDEEGDSIQQCEDKAVPLTV